jgi:hypothetical protein
MQTEKCNICLFSLGNTDYFSVLGTEKPTKVNEFRPISLCNVIYKVISKCIVSRLKGIMETVISENQGAFVGGRQIIFDNVMVCFEGIHSSYHEAGPVWKWGICRSKK